MKHRLSHLNFNDIEIPEVNIHSFEMGDYLLEVDYNDHKGYVFDDQDNIVKFRNVTQVKEALNECRVKHAYLVHQSAYDEMCGAAEGNSSELKIELNFKH
ncbi:DUF6482 family protein [Psychrosphaera haliotis]|nr:DUF6482 family protein [Psychrosphaera sp.]MDB2373207.1 DUF6482 family protein [Psychrosphaera haliotis]